MDIGGLFEDFCGFSTARHNIGIGNHRLQHVE